MVLIYHPFCVLLTAPVPTLVRAMLGNVPPTSRRRLSQMHEGDKLRKTDLTCDYEQSISAHSIVIIAMYRA